MTQVISHLPGNLKGINDVTYHAEVPYYTRPRIIGETVQNGILFLITDTGKMYVKELFTRFFN